MLGSHSAQYSKKSGEKVTDYLGAWKWTAAVPCHSRLSGELQKDAGQ